MNKVTVKIHDIEYNLKGEESEEYLRKAAAYVDDVMNNIKVASNNKLSINAIATLAAVRIVDEYFKAKENYQYSMKEFEEYYNEAEKIKAEYREFKKMHEALSSANEELVSKNQALETKVENLVTGETILEYDKEILRLKGELEITEEASRKYIQENAQLKSSLNELEVEINSAKYKLLKMKDAKLKLENKIIDLENQIISKDIEFAKEMKIKNTVLIK